MAFSFRRHALPALALCLCAPAAFAQSSTGGSQRPGTSTRGTSRTGTTGSTSGSRTGGGSSSLSSTGPRQYRSNTLLGDAIIQVDSESRSLVIITDEETNHELSKIIEDLDKPRPQVLIKVVFVEVTWDKSLDVGLEGNYTFNLGNHQVVPSATINTTSTTGTNTPSTTTNNNGTTTTAASSGNSTSQTTSQAITTAAQLAQGVTAGNLFGLSTATQGNFVRLLTDNYQATLRALASKGKVEVLSRPSIMARNNQEAVIVVGSEVPFITNSRVTEDGQTVNTIQYDNVGIILKVTPFITADRKVEMIVAPEISALTDQTVPISNTASAPVISKRSAETVVVTPDKATVVIGGLMQTMRTSTIQKVPVLGDIWGIGNLFRHKTTEDTKQELMIFLTPEIVDNGSQVLASAKEEARRSELIPDSFKKGEELNRYIDNPLFQSQEELSDQQKADAAKFEVDKKANAVPPPTHTISVTVRHSEHPAATPVPATEDKSR
jgi:general secretion pathway protein D